MPRDSALFTLLRIITVCLHTVKIHVYMLWLTTIMQRPAIARRTIAIELLRRLDQLERDMRRSRSPPPPHPHSTDVIQEDNHLISCKPDFRGRRPSFRTTHPQFTPLKQEGYTKSTTSRRATPNISDSSDGTDLKLVAQDAFTLCAKPKLIGTSSVQLCSSQGVQTDPWPRDPQDYNRLQIQAKQSIRMCAAGAEPTPPATPFKGAKLGNLHHNALDHVTPPQRGSQPFAVGNEGERVGVLPFQDDNHTTWQYNPSFSPLSGTWGPKLNEDTVEGAEESGVGRSDQTRVDVLDTVFNAVDEPRRPQHQRNDSVDSKPNATKTSSVTLRAQSKFNGGLLEFRATATRPKASKPARIHRRNLSINLPIRPISPQPESIQLSPSPPSTTSFVAPTSRSDYTSTATQIDRELQYKHRHIFIGTASLHSFLEVLETSSPGTTSKLAIMKAFTILASNEQVLFRQTSSSIADWNLVTRITPDISTFDCITLARVQLGCVSLKLFVDLIPFNTRDEAPTALVVEAFKNASHMDADAGLHTRSKARAFRTWMLEATDPLN